MTVNFQESDHGELMFQYTSLVVVVVVVVVVTVVVIVVVVVVLVVVSDCVTVLMTVNFQESDHGELMFQYLRHVRDADMPLMVAEFWSGWFDHWTNKHRVISNQSQFCHVG